MITENTKYALRVANPRAADRRIIMGPNVSCQFSQDLKILFFFSVTWLILMVWVGHPWVSCKDVPGVACPQNIEG
jgi:hypothetical protein